MKIIHVILGKANPNKMNGVNKVVNSLALAQTELGNDVKVWGITKNPIHNYPDRPYSTRLFKDLEKFSLPEGFEDAVLEEDLTTIFHIHGGFIPQFYSISVLLSDCDLNYIYTPHGSFNTIAMKRSWFKKRIYFYLYERKIIQHAKSIHFVGESEISGTNKLIKLKNHCLIPNGETVGDSSIELAVEHQKNPVFGFCGRLDIHTKGLDILLNGFSDYLNNHEGKGILWIIGDGGDKKELLELTKTLNLQSKVKYLGAQYGAQKLELFRKLDCFVLTSRNEGLPGVVLECAALGVPSIVSESTNVNKIKDYNAGLVLNTNTPHCLSDAFNTASTWLKEGVLIEKKKAAQEMIRNEYDWLVIAQKMVSIYAA